MRALLTVAGCTLLVAMPAMVAASESPRSYSSDLATLYHEHQRVLAMRDACIASQPAGKIDVAQAYDDWFARHSRTVDDLENRFAAVIKRASKDQTDYSRNYAKYQSEVLAMREDNKRTLLAQSKDKLAEQCAEFPAFLRHPRSDLRTMHPEEYKNVYRIR